MPPKISIGAILSREHNTELLASLLRPETQVDQRLKRQRKLLLERMGKTRQITGVRESDLVRQRMNALSGQERLNDDAVVRVDIDRIVTDIDLRGYSTFNGIRFKIARRAGRHLAINFYDNNLKTIEQLPPIINRIRDNLNLIVNPRYEPVSVTLYGYGNETGRQFRSVPFDDAANTDLFNDWIEEVYNSPHYEQLSGENYDFLPTFTVNFTSRVVHGNAGKFHIAKLLDRNEVDEKTDKQCANRLFAKFKIPFQFSREPSIEQICNYLTENKIQINVYQNTVIMGDYVKTGEYIRRSEIVTRNVKVQERTINYFKIDKPKLKPLYECEGTPISKWCYVNNHLCEIETELPDIYIKSGTLDYYADNGVDLIHINGHTGIQKECVDIKKQPKRKIFFDIEAIVNYLCNNIFQEYSISHIILNDDEIAELEKADKMLNIETLRNYKNRVINYYGFDCLTKFIAKIQEYSVDYQLHIIGFNNTNFDNYLLIQKLLEIDPKSVKSTNFSNGGILTADLSFGASFFDIAKHLTGTLKKCCKSFKVSSYVTKTELDHSYAQKLFDNGTLITNTKFIEDCNEYNARDVLCLPIILKRYQDALHEISPTLNLFGYKGKKDLITIGSTIWNYTKEHWKTLKYQPPKFLIGQQKYYDDIMKYKSAGRCDLFQNKKQKIKITQYCGQTGRIITSKIIASVDICSAYPFVMAIKNVFYPAGEIVETETYVPDKLGFYYCDIDQSNLKQVIQCEKVFNKKGDTVENNWVQENKLLENYFINTARIEYLIKNGCKVTVKNGIYFTDKIKGCELFKPILEIMQTKLKQDDFKATKNPLYNEVLRETAKLLMNSLSGKLIEQLHIEGYSIASVSGTEVDGTIEHIINDTHVLYKTDKSDRFEKIFKKDQRPIYMAALIYTYTQDHLYEHTIKNGKSFYFDTDSSKMKYEDFLEWKKYATNTPLDHWEEAEEFDPKLKGAKIWNEDPNTGFFKVFGSFEDELDKKDNITSAYFVGKKQYGIICDPLNQSKIVFKGIKVRTSDETGEIVENSVFLEDGQIPDDRIEFYNHHKHTVNNWIEMFERLFNDQSIQILCQNFAKSYKRGNHIGVKLQHIVKTIN